MNKFISIISIAAMILVAGACNKQDQPDEAPGKLSDLQYLIDGLVRTDEAGDITGYMIGDCLNEANPWEISVPVNNYDEAVATFRDLLPEGAQVTASGSSLIWTMTDEEGKPEGTAEFAEDPGLGAIAAVTVKPVLQAGAVKQVSPSVHFILTSAWPQNASAAKEILERDYYLGATVYMEENLGFGEGEFVVIRPWSSKECGIMVRLEKPGARFMVPQYEMSSLKTLHNVHKALYANYDLLVNQIGKEKNWPSLDRWYWSKENKYLIKEGFVNLKTDKEKWFYFVNRPGSISFAFIYCFKPDGKKIKYW